MTDAIWEEDEEKDEDALVLAGSKVTPLNLETV